MRHEIERKRLHYMQAQVVKYDDGSEVLISYSTPVVEKTPQGQYIRLWGSWSSTTNKQVHTYCGHSFRKLPFRDGTYEDLRTEYRRMGYTLEGTKEWLTPDECDDEASCYVRKLDSSGIHGYSTLYNKYLKERFKDNQRMKDLFEVMNMCARRKITNSKPVSALVKVHDFDFTKVWESGLAEQYPELKY